MTTPPQIGRNIYNQEIARGRQSAETIRRSLQRLNEDPGPREAAQLITRAALALNEIQAMLTILETIGRQSKTTQELKSPLTE